MQSLLQRRRLAAFAAAPVRLASSTTTTSTTTTSTTTTTTARESNIARLLRRPPSTAADTSASASDPGGTVTVNAFVRSVRKQKRIAFAALGDGSTLKSLQVVMKPEQAQGLSTGVGVTVSGQWLASRTLPQHQLWDIRLTEYRISQTYPLQKKYHSPEFLRTLPHLRTRLPFNSLMLRLRSQTIAHVTHFFAQQDFGAGDVFTTAVQNMSNREEDFFRSPKYLTVSSQLHLEALAQSKSDTPRHLSEFYMLEAEVSFTDSLEDVMDIVENMLRDVAQLLLARSPDWVKDEEHTGLIRAVTCLQDAAAEGKVVFEYKPSFDDGLQAEHERYLADNIGQGGPVFVTDYPRAVKPFYMAPSRTESSNSGLPTVACFDLIVPEICELVGGSLREHRLPELLAAMESHGISPHKQPDEHYESLPPNYSLSANMLAGAFAGIAEHSVMYPIDLLKTRMQVANPSPAAMYTGISNAMITITRLEGFRTLWRGVSSVVMGAGPAHAVYFATYEAVKHAAGGNEGGQQEHHPFAAALSGAAATIASDALMNPFDVMKQRMQIHGSIYKSLPHCARSVFRNEGLSAFYVSYPTTLCMTVPFTALQFVAYESLSKSMNPTGRWDPYTHCAAGGLAGGLAAGVTTPLDVIKTILQTRGSATDPELRNVKGLWQAAKIIKRRDGWRGFFRGLKPRIVTTMPSTAICWTAYEMAKAFFIAQNE
ncbi:mitochondrial carrier [Saccharata proteae CBS 121410]|uniref:Mitochondrial carrier n=1 Tax=Saccharata proteae CBS 121410 TaxID=1314787 RepID=A0A9P4LWN8_9PEZI|nr:mitochondrial carrier [Saccharata proteae CBS 121410]